MRRRALLSLGCALLAGCDRCGAEAPPQPGSVFSGRWEELHFPPSQHYAEPEMAAVLVEREAPLLVALHGRGEAGRGLEVGARGWRDDYHLDQAHARLLAPPLTRGDLLGFVTDERLAAMNASLARQPYTGLAVGCPYAPALFDRSVAGAEPFARFITRDLVPTLTRKLASRRAGIDGVSMGGRLALLVGLSHPDVFSSVGALQPAIGANDVGWLADMAAKAQAAGLEALRLVSSDGDPFLPAVQALSAALKERQVRHQLVITPGPHDYQWNRGPGAYEMLLWHERVLRDLPAP